MSDYSYITASMARFPDKYYTAGEVDSKHPLNCGAYHGQHNYVANLNFLFTTACKMRVRSDDNGNGIDSSNIRSFMSGISVKHTKDGIYGEEDFAAMRTTIVDAFSNMRTEFGTQTMAGYLRANNNKAKSYMILGLAVHMLGDTFAHRTMVPEDGGSKFTHSDFKDWNNFNKRLVDSVIEFRDIKSYTTTKMNSKYEDNTDFYPNRYNTTKKAVANLIALYQSNGSFNLASIVQGIPFNLELNNFQAYTYSAGYNTDVKAYSTGAFYADNPKNNDDKLPYNEADCKCYEGNNYIYMP